MPQYLEYLLVNDLPMHVIPTISSWGNNDANREQMFLCRVIPFLLHCPNEQKSQTKPGLNLNAETMATLMACQFTFYGYKCSPFRARSATP